MLKVKSDRDAIARIAHPPKQPRNFYTSPRPAYDLLPEHTGKEPCHRNLALFDQEDEDMDAEEIQAAKFMCESCPIMRACFYYAMVSNEHGIWGGTTTQDRQTIRYIATLR